MQLSTVVSADTAIDVEEGMPGMAMHENPRFATTFDAPIRLLRPPERPFDTGSHV